MLKTAIRIVMALAVIASLAACGSDDEPAPALSGADDAAVQAAEAEAAAAQAEAAEARAAADAAAAEADAAEAGAKGRG